MFVAFEDGEFHLESEFQNSWGGAMFIWNTLIDKHKVPGAKHPWGDEGDAYKNLWKLPQETFKPWEWNALNSTYDNVVVTREHMLVIAESLEMFEEAHGSPNRVCSLKAQAKAIREHHKAGAIAIAWNQTSVCGDPFCGSKYDEETDTYIPYNIKTGDNHWEFEAVALK